jgi:hypothetical protein
MFGMNTTFYCAKFNGACFANGNSESKDSRDSCSPIPAKNALSLSQIIGVLPDL